LGEPGDVGGRVDASVEPLVAFEDSLRWVLEALEVTGSG
jgi:hypothetical protein